jgi:hypothetical protein
VNKYFYHEGRSKLDHTDTLHMLHVNFTVHVIARKHATVRDLKSAVLLRHN